MRGSKSSVVDADERRGELEGRVEFARVVHLDQDSQPERTGGRFQVFKPCAIKRSDDQQYTVGSPRARLRDLVFVHDEVLAQDRQCAGGARCVEMLGCALKKRHVGQYRQAGSATTGITRTDRGGIKVSAQHSFGWRCLLHFRDDRGAPGGDPCAQPAFKISHILTRPCAYQQRCGRFVCLGGGDLLALDRDDALEDVAHDGGQSCTARESAGACSRRSNMP